MKRSEDSPAIQGIEWLAGDTKLLNLQEESHLGKAASELWTRPLTWLPARAWPPTARSVSPRSRTGPGAAGWADHHGAVCQGNVVISHQAVMRCLWPTSWTRGAGAVGVGRRLDLGWHRVAWQPDLPSSTQTGVHSSVSSAGAPSSLGANSSAGAKAPSGERLLLGLLLLLGWREQC